MASDAQHKAKNIYLRAFRFALEEQVVPSDDHDSWIPIKHVLLP